MFIFVFFKEAKDTKVIEAKFFTTPVGTGVAVLTSAYRIFLVTNASEPKIRRISNIPSKLNCF